MIEIQAQLKAPKNQRNTFGNYNYRSCEDVLEAVKPLCAEKEALLTITDSIEQIGDKYFVKATATYQHESFTTSVDAYAMHALTKKGMDDSQITGAASSYARKYALNGLFLIDDSKDADAQDNAKIERQPEKIITQSQLAELLALISEVAADEHKLLAYFKIPSVDEIPASKYAAIIRALEKKRGK